MYIIGNVTLIFLSFSRLKSRRLGQIKDTIKRYGIKRKRRVDHVTLKRKIRITIGILLLLLFVSFPFLTDIKQFISIPNKIITFESNQPMSIPPLGEDYSIKTNKDDNIILQENKIYPENSGNSAFVYKKANIPVKKVDISVLKEKQIVPGGQSVGVQLHTMGVLVVGHHLINKGEEDSPGENADIHVGDVILEMNGSSIKQMEDVKPIVKEAGDRKSVV